MGTALTKNLAHLFPSDLSEVRGRLYLTFNLTVCVRGLTGDRKVNYGKGGVENGSTYQRHEIWKGKP